jgi:tetratricopeptide (TPR) repeat protein
MLKTASALTALIAPQTAYTRLGQFDRLSGVGSRTIMPSETLLDSKFMGGLDGAKGYRFEHAYVLSQLPFWLGLSDMKSFQQEGWSDVELFFESGLRWLIQIKNHPLTAQEFREIVRDFSAREKANPALYEKYIIASTGLAPSVEQLNRQLNRLRGLAHYTEGERADAERIVLKTVDRLKAAEFSDLIVGKLHLDSDAASARSELFCRNAFIGSIVSTYRVSVDTAEDIFERSARLIAAARGKPVELSLLHNALRQKQLEDQAGSLSNFTLVTKELIGRCEGDDSASYFYTGATPSWADIAHGRDVPRDTLEIVISQIRGWNQGRLLVPIFAEAGEGKSTFLRRLAVELAADNKAVLYHNRGAVTADAKEVQWTAEQAGRCVYILLDDASRISNFNGFVNAVSELPFPVVMVAAARPYEAAPIKAAYSANVEVGLGADGCEYSLAGLSERELELLIRRLYDGGLIHLPREEDIPLAVAAVGKKTKGKFLVLVLELTQGRKVREVIRDEIERVRQKGERCLAVYRDICLMASLHSFVTLPMLERLHGEDVGSDVRRLPGLVEMDGQTLRPRHDRIGEMVADIMFEGEDERRGDLLCRLITVAIEEDVLDVIRAMRGGASRGVPSSQIVKVIGHLVDEAFCCGEWDLIKDFLEDLHGDRDNTEVHLELLASKTPLVWEQLIFPGSHRIDWKNVAQTFNVSFSWPPCVNRRRVHPNEGRSLETALGWAQVFSFAAWSYSDYRQFFIAVADRLYQILAELYPDSLTTICFQHAEFLSESDDGERAIEIYERVIRENPTHADAHAGLALTLYLKNDYKRALYHYKRAVSLDRDSIFRVNQESIFEEMLARFGELEEYIEYRKGTVRRQFKTGRGFQKIISMDPSLLIDLKAPDSSEGIVGLNNIHRGDYSEETELRSLRELDNLLAYVKTIDEEQRIKIGKMLSEWFGELRQTLSEETGG